MALSKTEKGTKRLCENCNTRWYDLNKKPLLCPVCNTELEINDLIYASSTTANFINKNKNNSDIKPDDINEENIEAGEDDGSEIISLEEVEVEEEKN